MDFLISPFFPYIVPSSVYTIKNASNLERTGRNFAQFSDHIFPLGEKKMKSRVIVIAPLPFRDAEYALTRKANIGIDKVFRSKGIKWESGNPISRRVAFPVRHNYIQLKAQQVTASTR